MILPAFSRLPPPDSCLLPPVSFPMTDDQLIHALESGTLSPEDFHHADHVHAAWVYLTRYPAPEAIARFTRALRGFAGRIGKPGLYHETITWAYLLLVNERIGRRDRACTWEEFAASESDLLDWQNPVLAKYYRKETLASDLARRIFLMPDATK